MVLEKMAAISTGSMDVLVGAGSKGIKLQRSLDDALKWILRDGKRMEGDRNREVMSRANGGNDVYRMTSVYGLLQMDEQQFNDFLKKIGWEDVIESDANGMNCVSRDHLQVMTKILRDRTVE